MADLWLERELARQLAPVMAPDSLWDRIERGSSLANRGTPHAKQARRDAFEWLFWPIAAVLTLLAIAGVLRSSGAEPDLAGLPSAATRLEYRARDFESARAWVKAQANIDIDLPSGAGAPEPGLVQVLGARLVDFRGTAVAAIDCRIGGKTATLFVSGRRAGLAGGGGSSPHLLSRLQAGPNERVLSWNMRNQTYAIAFAGAGSEPAACRICHANTPGLTLLGTP